MVYRSDIDGLRAISILFVVIFHAFPTVLLKGFIGVDVFFVISGFLISQILFKQLEDGEGIDFINFYKRRVYRLFPALLFVILTAILIGYIELTPNEFNSLGKHVISSVLFIENFTLINESLDYFNASANVKPLMHLWSLSIEEQFYLVYPFLIFLFRKSQKMILNSIILILILSLCFNVTYSLLSISSSYFSPISRAWELMAGCLCACIYRGVNFKSLIKSKLVREVIPIIGLSLIFIGLLNYHGGRLNNIISIFFAVVGTMVVILSSENTLLGSFFSNKVLVFIGKISYPLYLWHWVILSYFRIIESESLNNKHAILAIVISFILASFTYIYIEEGFKKIRKNKAGIIIALSILSLLSGFIIIRTDGFPNREHFLKLEDVDHRKLNYQFSSSSDVCSKFYPEFASNCHLSKEKEPKIMIIGDSHAEDLYPGIANTFGSSVLSFSVGGCQAIVGTANSNQTLKSCKKTMDRAIQFAAESSEIETVILTSFYNNISFSEINQSNRVYFEESASKVFDTLLGKSKDVIYVLDRPELPRHIKECMNIRPFRLPFHKDNNCDQHRTSVDEKLSRYHDIMLNVLSDYPQIKVLDSRDVFCSTETCFAKFNEKSLYRDKHHLSMYGSTVISEKLLKLIGQKASIQ